MEPDKQAAYTPGPHEWVKINVGVITEDELKNIARELKSLWQYLEDVTPKAEMKATRDHAGQYYIHLNGRALLYILIFCKKLQPIDLRESKQAAEIPMPANFLAPD